MWTSFIKFNCKLYEPSYVYPLKHIASGKPCSLHPPHSRFTEHVAPLPLVHSYTTRKFEEAVQVVLEPAAGGVEGPGK